MLQNKSYQQPTKTNATKQELPTTTTKNYQHNRTQTPPNKTNATKQELPTTTTKTNATKQELPTTTTKTLPTIKKQEPQTPPPRKTNATKQELPTTTTTIKKPIVENQTSGKTSVPTELSNNISNNTAKVGDKINLAIENIVVERSITNSIQIKGDIKNNSPLDLQDIKISAEYFDKAGTLLEKVEHFITSPSYILKPNGQVSFNILEVLGFGFQKLGDYNIVANGETIK